MDDITTKEGLIWEIREIASKPIVFAKGFDLVCGGRKLRCVSTKSVKLKSMDDRTKSWGLDFPLEAFTYEELAFIYIQILAYIEYCKFLQKK